MRAGRFLAAFALLGWLPAAAETLSYMARWPSGLSLGEAQIVSNSQTGGGWSFEFRLDAALPGFAISEQHQAKATAAYCSTEFIKQGDRGPRRMRESETFDPATGLVTRKTQGGGTSELPAGPCARDALTFLAFTRSQFAKGSLPKAATVWFGAPYEVTLTPAGPAVFSGRGAAETADKVLARIRGASSDLSVEFLFARDATRTPLAVRVPFSMGAFSLELTR